MKLSELENDKMYFHAAYYINSEDGEYIKELLAENGETDNPEICETVLEALLNLKKRIEKEIRRCYLNENL